MAQNNNNSLAMIKKDTVDIVSERVREFQESGRLHLPANYSAENAMKSAWLVLQNTKDKNGNPALKACTKDSIANSLLDMVVQGLNPAKKQCYFVVYGNQLVCMRSYFGSMALVKRVFPKADIYYGVVYEGDEFTYEIKKGRKHIVKHQQSLGNVKKEAITAAYCVIEFGDERPDHTEIMTIDQIKQAWMQGKVYKEGGDGTHHKFTDQMAMKTVINRACKAVINSSSDDYLLLRKHFNRTDAAISEHDLESDIADDANGPVIDIEPEPEETSAFEDDVVDVAEEYQLDMEGPEF